MRIAIIGRTRVTYQSARLLIADGHEIPLIITSKEAPEYDVTANDFKLLAEEIGARFIYSPSINIRDHKATIEAIGNMDIAVSINYTGVIPQDFIDIFPLGILNGHAGDLPRYRGNAPLAWAILNGETRMGLCIHRMIGGELDSGNIMALDFHPITINTRIGQLFEWVTRRIPEMMLEVVSKLSKEFTYSGQPQSKDPKDALRGYPRLPEDGAIDWRQSNVEICRLINASSEPFAGAFCQYNENPITIWRAEIFDNDENYLAVPGQVATISPDGSIVVITGSGKLRITDISYEGIRLAPAQIIKSIRRRLK